MRWIGLLPLLLASPALAQDVSERLLDLLGRAPDDLLPAHFVDVAAARAALAPTMRAPPEWLDPEVVNVAGPFARAVPEDLAGTLWDGLDGAWRPIVGFDPGEVEATLGAGLPPGRVLMLRLQPEAAARVPAALLAQGYAEVGGGTARRFERGAEDLAVDLASRNPADPFGGALGQSSRVLLHDTLLVRGATRPAVQAVAAGTGPSADDRALAAAIQALAPPGASLVQAMVFAGPGDPWRLGLLADLSGPEGEVALALFAGEGKGDAVPLSRAAIGFWQDQAAVRTRLVEAPARTVQAGEGPHLGGVAIEVAPGPGPGGGVANPAFDLLLRLWATGELEVALRG